MLVEVLVVRLDRFGAEELVELAARPERELGGVRFAELAGHPLTLVDHALDGLHHVVVFVEVFVYLRQCDGAELGREAAVGKVDAAFDVVVNVGRQRDIRALDVHKVSFSDELHIFKVRVHDLRHKGFKDRFSGGLPVLVQNALPQQRDDDADDRQRRDRGKNTDHRYDAADHGEELAAAAAALAVLQLARELFICHCLILLHGVILSQSRAAKRAVFFSRRSSVSSIACSDAQ